MTDDLRNLFAPENGGTLAVVAGVPVYGHFTRRYVEIQDMAGEQPMFLGPHEDLQELVQGAEIVVDGRWFKVSYVQPSARRKTITLILREIAQPAGEGVVFNFNQPFIQGPDGMKQNDHRVYPVVVDGKRTWHLIGIRCDSSDTGSMYFSHYTSPDRRTWTEQPVIEVGTGIADHWRNIGFAPFVMLNPGYGGDGALASFKHLMFWTGVTKAGGSYSHQKIALSGCRDDDCSVWEILNDDQPIYWSGMPTTTYPDGAPWAEYGGAWYGDSRDPSVYYDGEHWRMILTCRAAGGGNDMVIGLATVAGGADPDFLSLDHAPAALVVISDGSQYSAEACSMFKHRGLYSLYFGGSGGTRLQDLHPDMMGPPWDTSIYAGERVNDVGPGTGLANDVFQVEGDVFNISGHIVKGSYYYYKINELLYPDDGGQPVERALIGIDGLVGLREGKEDLSLGWSIIDTKGSLGAFYNQPVFGDQALATDGVASGHTGNSYIAPRYRHNHPGSYYNGMAYSDYSRIGCIKSSEFIITRNRISLLVAGGKYPNAEFVALVDANTDRILFSETGKDGHSLSERVWDLSSIRGRNVYLVIADMATGDYGYIAADLIREYELPTEDGDSVAASQPFEVGALLPRLLTLGGL
ncbi:MAG: glycoside hydrolase family 32 protein [bacterium]|nr:glycoside hydrolase family 32 protein [bacterium]